MSPRSALPLSRGVAGEARQHETSTKTSINIPAKNTRDIHPIHGKYSQASLNNQPENRWNIDQTSIEKPSTMAPTWASRGPLGGLLGALGGLLGPLVSLGRLGGLLGGVPGASWRPLGPSWGVVGGQHGPILGPKLTRKSMQKFILRDFDGFLRPKWGHVGSKLTSKIDLNFKRLIF